MSTIAMDNARVVNLLSAHYGFGAAAALDYLNAALADLPDCCELEAPKTPPKSEAPKTPPKSEKVPKSEKAPKTPPKSEKAPSPGRAHFLDSLAAAESKDAAKKAEKAAKKAAKAAKKAAREGKPKRAATGYLLFCSDLRPDVKAALEAQLPVGDKLSPQSTVTELAAQWKALSDVERGDWNAKALAIKEKSGSSGSSSDGSVSE